MPFVSKAQNRKCWALKTKGQNGSWDCSEWASATSYDHLPEKEKQSQIDPNDYQEKTSMDLIRHLAKDAATTCMVDKLARDMQTTPELVTALAATAHLPADQFVKRAYANPEAFVEFVKAAQLPPSPDAARIAGLVGSSMQLPGASPYTGLSADMAAHNAGPLPDSADPMSLDFVGPRQTPSAPAGPGLFRKLLPWLAAGGVGAAGGYMLGNRKKKEKEASFPVLGALLGGGIGAARAPVGARGEGAARGAVRGGGIELGASAGTLLGALGGHLADTGLSTAGHPLLVGGALAGALGGGYAGHKMTDTVLGDPSWDKKDSKKDKKHEKKEKSSADAMDLIARAGRAAGGVAGVSGGLGAGQIGNAAARGINGALEGLGNAIGNQLTPPPTRPSAPQGPPDTINRMGLTPQLMQQLPPQHPMQPQPMAQPMAQPMSQPIPHPAPQRRVPQPLQKASSAFSKDKQGKSKLPMPEHNSEPVSLAMKTIKSAAMRSLVVKKAAQLCRKQAAATMCEYLDAVTAILPLEKTANVRALAKDVAQGVNLSAAIKTACPTLTGEARGVLAHQLVQASLAWRSRAV